MWRSQESSPHRFAGGLAPLALRLPLKGGVMGIKNPRWGVASAGIGLPSRPPHPALSRRERVIWGRGCGGVCMRVFFLRSSPRVGYSPSFVRRPLHHANYP